MVQLELLLHQPEVLLCHTDKSQLVENGGHINLTIEMDIQPA